MHLYVVLWDVLTNTPAKQTVSDGGGGYGTNYSWCVKASFNCYGFMMVAILSDSEFHDFIFMEKNEYL